MRHLLDGVKMHAIGRQGLVGGQAIFEHHGKVEVVLLIFANVSMLYMLQHAY